MTPWLVVAGDFTPFGGMDAANLALARYLAACGSVEVVAHEAAADLTVRPSVRFRKVPRPLGMHALGEPLLERVGRSAARQIGAGGRVVVNGGNCYWPDINWVHFVHSVPPPPRPAGWARSVKQAVYRNLAVRRERNCLRAARVVVCNSRRTARDVVERVGVAEAAVRVVYYGCDPDRFGPITTAARAAARAAVGWDDRPWALFVGGLGDARKGFDTLYDSWRRLCRRPGWDANLAVVGRGAEVPGLRARAVADGLGDRVHFLGFRTDVPQLLAAADVMVHPARYEAYGLGVHEALCRGVPAVVSASAGVAERYPPGFADLMLPDPEAPADLADRLVAWRGDLDGWASRAAAAAPAFRAYTWDHMAADFVRAAAHGPPPDPSP